MSDLPEGWAKTTISCLSKIVTSGSRDWSKFYSDFGAYFIRSAEINDYNLRLSEAIHVALPETTEGKRALVEKGDILVTITGANVGKCARVVSEIPEAYVSQSVALIKMLDRSLGDFVYFAMRSPTASGTELTNMSYGVGRPVLSLPQIKSLSVPLAPLAEQKRIVAKLEALLTKVDACRDRLDNIATILKRSRQSVLAAACSGALTADWREENHEDAEALLQQLEKGRNHLWHRRRAARSSKNKGDKPRSSYRPGIKAVDIDELPATWSSVSVDQISLIDVGFAFKSAEFSDTGIRLVRGENLEPGRLRWNETRCWPAHRIVGFEHLLLEPGEIVLALDRPVISSGLKIARVKESDTPCLLVQRMMRFKMVDPTMTDWLHLNLSLPRFIEHLAQGMTGSDIPHITGTTVAEYSFGLPPMAEQMEIQRRTNEMLSMIDVIDARLQTARNKVDAITTSALSASFRGELVPTEAELAAAEGRTYETAAELLARIKSSTIEQQSTPKRKVAAARAGK